ncbi:MAG: hypothetical protein LC689_22800 [Myxococcales bacterium]|nr:hypothetical protein [Myxococcales bacterium]
MIQAQIDLLLQYMAARSDELVRGKEEYFARTGGEVHEEDRCYEQRMQAFFNWFLFDRKLADGSTPVELYLREKGAELPGKEKDVLLGCTQSRLSLYEYRGRRGFFSRPGKGQVRVRDAITGEDYDVTERRQMHGLEVTDLFEARLVPLARTFLFSSSFTYHPREMNRVIRRELKRRKKAGSIDAREFCWELERMALQQEHFKNVSIDAIYNFDTPFLSKRPRAEEQQQGG